MYFIYCIIMFFLIVTNQYSLFIARHSLLHQDSNYTACSHCRTILLQWTLSSFHSEIRISFSLQTQQQQEWKNQLLLPQQTIVNIISKTSFPFNNCEYCKTERRLAS